MTVFEENEGVIKILLFTLDYGQVKYDLCLVERYETYNLSAVQCAKRQNVRRRGEEAEKQLQQQLCYQQEGEQRHDQTPLIRFKTMEQSRPLTNLRLVASSKAVASAIVITRIVADRIGKT